MRAGERQWYNAPMRKLSLLTLGFFILLNEGGFAWADVPDDKTERLREYQRRHFEFTPQGSSSYEIRQGAGTESLRVSERPVVEQASDSLLLGELEEAEFGRSWVQLAWSLGLPLGAYLVFDNFVGKPRPAGVDKYLPEPRLSFFPGNDWRSFTLASGGIWLGTYGMTNLASWVSERCGWSFASLLPVETAKSAVKKANDRLREELILVADDVASASQIIAAGASASASTLVGEEGSAGFYLTKASETIRAQRGDGFKLYLVYTKELADKSGKLQRGSWHYLYFHPQKLEAFDVNVPVFGDAPSVGPAPDAFKEWRTATTLSEQWKIDSTKAMAELQAALVNRGIPWLPEEVSFLLYPHYGNFQVPVWVLDQGIGPLEVGYDAAGSLLIDLNQAGRGVLPGNAGANPGGTSPGAIRR